MAYTGVWEPTCRGREVVIGGRVAAGVGACSAVMANVGVWEPTRRASKVGNRDGVREWARGGVLPLAAHCRGPRHPFTLACWPRHKPGLPPGSAKHALTSLDPNFRKAVTLSDYPASARWRGLVGERACRTFKAGGLKSATGSGERGNVNRRLEGGYRMEVRQKAGVVVRQRLLHHLHLLHEVVAAGLERVVLRLAFLESFQLLLHTARSAWQAARVGRV
eukprot:365159-Chlamydomonas_euryale.AAC.18